MQWREVDGAWSADISEASPPGLRLESSRPRRLRLSLSGVGRIWARVEPRCEGVWILRSDEDTALNIVSPIRASEARSVARTSWLHRFAKELDESTRSPLTRGSWRLTPLVPRRATLAESARDVSPDVFFSTDAEALPSAAYGTRAAIDLPRIHYQDWGINGSGDVIPLRDFSALDSGRVKSWRKHAREGTLPPILVWWVSALDVYLILDGHDRLRAAIAEGVTPRLIALWQRHLSRVGVDETMQDEFVIQYEKAFSNDHVSIASRQNLNRQLGYLFDPVWSRAITTARANRELESRWLDEVRERGAGSEHLGDLLGETGDEAAL